MRYLIDSDILIDHFQAFPSINQLLDRLADEGIAMSAVTYMETYQGVLRSPDQQAANARFERLLADMPVLPFSRAVARRCAQLRETLKQQGKRVRSRALDLMIAATALEMT